MRSCSGTGKRGTCWEQWHIQTTDSSSANAAMEKIMTSSSVSKASATNFWRSPCPQKRSSYGIAGTRRRTGTRGRRPNCDGHTCSAGPSENSFGVRISIIALARLGTEVERGRVPASRKWQNAPGIQAIIQGRAGEERQVWGVSQQCILVVAFTCLKKSKKSFGHMLSQVDY